MDFRFKLAIFCRFLGQLMKLKPVFLFLSKMPADYSIFLLELLQFLLLLNICSNIIYIFIHYIYPHSFCGFSPKENTYPLIYHTLSFSLKYEIGLVSPVWVVKNTNLSPSKISLGLKLMQKYKRIPSEIIRHLWGPLNDKLNVVNSELKKM